jgi:hypothetical protein
MHYAMTSTRRWVVAALMGCAVAGLLAGTGCARRYRITLNNGSMIDTKGKPKLDRTGTVYHYKNVLNQEGTVPAFKVNEIAPRSMSSQPHSYSPR